MNVQNLSESAYSPLSVDGESNDIVSSDSHSITSTPPIILGGTTCLPKKRKAGRKLSKETRHPIYRGVRHRDGGKWVCEVREPYKKTRMWLGTYPTAELAARAYDVATLALRGDHAALNFADSVQLAPRPKSNSARDIRLAAIEATRVCKIEEEKMETWSTSYSVVEEKSVVEDMFLDEEALFNMPVLIDSMAEGMLLTPPALKKGVNWDEINQNSDEYVSYMDLDLW